MKAKYLELGQKIQNEARTEIEKMQREYFLREQLKAIQRELGEGDEQTADVEEFRRKLEAAKMPEEAEKQARRELERLSRLPSAAAEYGVIRTYLDWLVSLPWSSTTEDNLDIQHARNILNEDHYGLTEVKERILEFLAVRKLRKERKGEIDKNSPKDYIRKMREGVILCFVGPPGVGKTSLGNPSPVPLAENSCAYPWVEYAMKLKFAVTGVHISEPCPDEFSRLSADQIPVIRSLCWTKSIS